MSFLLLDECIAKCCVDGGAIYTAQRFIEVEGLGQQAEDPLIYEFVLSSNGCILVTANGRDYADLAVRHGLISVVVLPAVPPKVQHSYLKGVMPLANAVFAKRPGRFVEVSRSGKVISYAPHQGVAWRQRNAFRSAEAFSTAIH